MPLVGFELRFAGASCADAAAEAAHLFVPRRQPRQIIFILGKLHLQLALARLCALGKNIEDEGAPVENVGLRGLLERAHLRGREVVVEDHERRACVLHPLAYLFSFSFTDERVWVRLMPVLQNFPHADAARRFEQRLQLVQCPLVRGLFFGKQVAVQADQNGLLLHDLDILFHKNTSIAPHGALWRCIGAFGKFRQI